MAFQKVALRSQLSENVGHLIECHGKKIALFWTGTHCFALDDLCPHRGAPLHEGECDGQTVTCPWHNAAFDLATGQHLSPPAKSGVRSYPVQIIEDEIHLDLEG